MEMKNAAYTSFSVVMTCYNLEKYIAEAVKSVLRQKYRGEVELIIVDDCSTDCSVEEIKRTIEEYGEGWEITLVQMEQNAGVAGACDAGWARARHEWIILVDGDDIQEETRLQTTHELLKRHRDAVMIACSANHADMNGEVYGYQGYCWKPYEISPEFTYLSTPEERLNMYILPDGYPRWRVFGCSMAIKRELYTKWGAMTKDGNRERMAQDPTWFLRAVLTGPVLGSREPVCKYRAHESNILNRTFSAKKLSDWIIHEKHMIGFLKLNLLNFNQELRDIQRAKLEITLSDCTKEQIAKLEEHIRQKRQAYEILANWWDLSFFKKLAIAVHNPLPANFRKWPWPRLLPFRLFVLMRWLVKRSRRG